MLWLPWGCIAFWEFDHIAESNGIARSGYAGMLLGLALMFAPRPEIVVVLAALSGMTLALRVANLAGAMAAGGAFALGVVYIFGSLRCAIDLRAINPHWLMFALLLSWAGDTAALYIGKAFGKHKLAPRVSPAKTWEGAIGSVAGGILAGWVYAHYLIPAAGDCDGHRNCGGRKHRGPDRRPVRIRNKARRGSER